MRLKIMEILGKHNALLNTGNLKVPYAACICTLLAIFVAGCSIPLISDNDDAPVPSTGIEDANYEPWQETSPVYRLQNGDEIRVIHPHSSELNQDVKILPDGKIYLPMIGAIQAADSTPGELSEHLVQAYSSELIDPDVAVVPKKIGKQEVFVGGEVDEPGLYEFNGKIGVIEAVFLAGGIENTGNSNEVVILRRTKSNTAMMRTVDMGAILTGKQASYDIPLQQYDIVFVPRTTAAEVGVWVEQHITNILPFSRSFSYSISNSTDE